MKNLILFLLLFTIQLNLHGQATCEDVFFTVNYNPSECTGLDDEFCIDLFPTLTDPGCFPDGFNSVYLWRVRFSNSDFNILNFGNFTENTAMSTIGVTVIEVNANSGFNNIAFPQGCFSGEVLNSNADFTFTFESVDGINIIDTLTFSPEDIKTITEDMTVTEAIQLGLLNPSGQANLFLSEPQNIRIAANLIIDQDYAFRNGSQVTMISEDSKITVNPNINFSVTDFSDVKGCGIIWDQIENNGTLNLLRGSSIADAKIGINSKSGSELNTVGITVRDCTKGMKMSGSASISFGGGDFMINCKTGMEITDLVQTLMIPLGLFNACEKGIDANGANLILTDCDFINNTAPGLFFPSGVAVVSKNSDVFLSQDCSFFQNDVGISLSDITSTIIQSNSKNLFGADFSENFADIFISPELSQVVNIENSVFRDATIHNVILSMQPGTVKIINNVFDGEANNIRGGSNILVNAIGHGQHRVSISENDMSSKNTNVILTNTNRASVHNNTKLDAENQGVIIQGGQMNGVVSNKIISTFNEAVNLQSSPFSNIFCNDSVVSENSAGLTIDGPNQGAEVLRNGLIGDLGLVYTPTGATGIQVNKRNLFQDSDEGSQARAIHNGIFPLLDRYFVKDLTTGGFVTLPEFAANSPDWFAPFEREEKRCPVRFEPISDDDNLIGVNDIPNALSLINQIQPIINTDSLYVTTYPIYKLLKSVYAECTNNCLEILFDDWISETNLSNDEVLNLFSFVAESESGILELDFDADQWFIDIDPLYEDMYQYELAAQNLGKWEYLNELAIENLNDEITSLAFSYKQHLNKLGQSDTILVDSTEFFQKSLDNQISILNNLYIDQSVINDNTLADLTTLNNSIDVPYFTVDDHIKRVNNIAIELMLGMEESQLFSDTSYLKTIADGCPYTKGSAKYHAQSLYQNLTNYRGEFVDNCSEIVPRFKRHSEALADDYESFKVYPNPSNDHIIIEKIDQNATVEKIYIYDAFGKLISEVFFQGDKIKLDISNYPEGVYFIKRIEEDGTTKFLKIK